MGSWLEFSSTRERRLWLAAATAVILIYSTLGLAQILAEEMRNQNLLSQVFWIGLWLVVAAIVVLGLTSRPGWLVVGVALGIVGVYVLVMARMASPEERSHMIEYGVVAALIYVALLERSGNGGRPSHPALVAIGLTGVIGTVDEFIQLVMPSRVFDLRDIGFNVLAAGLAVAAVASIAWARRRVARRRRSTKNGRDPS